MKVLKLAFPILLALAAVSCNKDARMSGSGRISFALTSDYSVADATKSQVSAYTTLPSAGSFSIEISGNNYSWTGLVSEWDEATALAVGNYTVSAVYGEEGVEGFDKPYFVGQKDFSIAGAQTTEVSIPVSLANTIVRVECTEMFNNYFPEYTFTVTTGNGTEIVFAKGETRAAFVDAYKFTVNGELENQSGNAQTFSKEYNSLEPKTCYTLKFDVSATGSASISVTFDDTTEEVVLEDIDLNE